MLYRLNVSGDMLSCGNLRNANSGNTGTYECEFTFTGEWAELSAFGVFITKDKAYSVPIIGGKCVIAAEALSTNGVLDIGVFGTNGSSTDLKRISTNLVRVFIDEGAYRDAAAPETPTPSAWETYAAEMKKLQQAAASSASSALSAKTAAETAQGKAETAQGKAETAKSGAESAKSAAEAASRAAQTAKTTAEGAATEATAKAAAAGESAAAAKKAEDSTKKALAGYAKKEDIKEYTAGNLISIENGVIKGVRAQSYSDLSGFSGNVIATPNDMPDLVALVLSNSGFSAYMSPEKKKTACANLGAAKESDVAYASQTAKGTIRAWLTTESGESVLNLATEDSE